MAFVKGKDTAKYFRKRASYKQTVRGFTRRKANMRKRYPGKFEGCADDRLGEALYNLGSYDDETGDVCEVGLWAGLVLNKRPAKGGESVTWR